MPHWSLSHSFNPNMIGAKSLADTSPDTANQFHHVYNAITTLLYTLPILTPPGFNITRNSRASRRRITDSSFAPYLPTAEPYLANLTSLHTLCHSCFMMIQQPFAKKGDIMSKHGVVAAAREIVKVAKVMEQSSEIYWNLISKVRVCNTFLPWMIQLIGQFS